MTNDLNEKSRNDVSSAIEKGELEQSKQGPAVVPNPFFANPFFQFRIAHGEISSSQGKTHIRHREHRFENGKYSTTEFDGTAGGEVYRETAKQMQNLFSQSVETQLKLWQSMMFPFAAPKDKK